jgi:hypothetical protein
MNVYLCLLIPLITIIVLFVMFKHKTVWWEFLIPVAATLLFILISKQIAISSLTDDTQYLGGYVKEVRYYEPWNERVSCRHPKYCTRYKSCCTRTKNGCTGCLDRYQCGWQHLYDVDYHPASWTMETNLGTIYISEQRYKEILTKNFKVNPIFHELNRHSHTIDGDMYSGTWNGTDETIVPITIEDHYENRPQASHSIYHFNEVDTFDIREYGLYKYPTINDHNYQKTLLGINDPIAERKLAVLNARLGELKHVRVFILVFNDKSVDAGHLQERYWQGGNKNEFVICVGLSEDKEVKWVYDFSWTEVEETKIETREFMLANESFDLNSLIDFTEQEINSKWIMRDFHKFDMLTIDPSMTAVFWIFFLTIVLNIGLAWWIVKNDLEDEPS